MPGPPTVDAYLAALDPTVRAVVDALRHVVIGAHPGLGEEIKWNAPSFSHRGEDRVTLNVDGKGGLRLVLHRGAKPKHVGDFRFEDGAGLAKWPAPDRGVIALKDLADLEAKAAPLSDLVGRWIVANA